MKAHNHNRRILFCIVLAGFLIRLAFVLKINAVLYGAGNAYTNGDSASYSGSVLNLIRHGKYTFDLANPEAYFGRLPGYPLFWGLIYLITGSSKAYIGVALCQVLIDTCCIYLVYRTSVKVGFAPVVGLIAAALYCTYFFLLVWVPVTGTEAIATDAVVFLFFLLSGASFSKTLVYWLGIGLTTAVCFYIREYLGILLPIVCCWLTVQWLRKKGSFAVVFICVSGFMMLYIFWPVRNYVNYHRVEFAKPITGGYKNFTEDYNQFRSWVYCWNTSVEPYHSAIIKSDSLVVFPAVVYEGGNKNKIDHLITLARTEGSGFYHWRLYAGWPDNKPYIDSFNRNKEIAEGFKELQSDFKKRHPEISYVAVPAKNLSKAFFKSSLSDNRDNTSGVKATASKMLFGYRTLLILLGLIGLFIMPSSLVRFGIAAFFIFMYAFICIVLKQVEMRYLLQADVLLLLPAARTIYQLALRWNKRTEPQRSKATIS